MHMRAILRRLPHPYQPVLTCKGVQEMKLTRRGKQVRGIFIYVLILSVMIAISSALGVWDVPESCLVEMVGCPDDYILP